MCHGPRIAGRRAGLQPTKPFWGAFIALHHEPFMKPAEAELTASLRVETEYREHSWNTTGMTRVGPQKPKGGCDVVR